MNYKQVATEVLAAVGGKENIISVVHCITRLRFKLKDTGIPKKEAVEKINGVISVIEKGGQYQVVIGNEVEPVFNEVKKLIGEQTEQTGEKEERKKGNLFERFTSLMSGVFLPVLGVLAACGMLKGILTICTVGGILSEKDSTYIVLYAIANLIFYFFPIFLGISAAKHFEMDIFLGGAIGAALIYPTIVAASSNGTIQTFLGLPMSVKDYTSTVFPVIIAVWFASYIEKFLKEHCPSVIKMFTVPLVTLVISVPVTLWVIGPGTTFLSSILANIVLAAYSFSPTLAGVIIGGPWIIAVMFGLHWAFIPIFISDIATNGSEPLMGLLSANQFAMAGAMLAVALIVKNKDKKSLGFTTSLTCLLGVSEPGLYGILLPLKKPFIASIIAGSIGGAIGGFCGTTNYGFGAAGLFGIPMTLSPNGVDVAFIGGVIECAVGFILGFIITYVLMYKNKTNTFDK